MSASNGSVGVEVQVPVLGTLVGTRTLKDAVAGVPSKPPADGPAVTVRDPDARTLAALTGAAAPTAAAPAARKTDEAIAPAAPAAPAVAPAAPSVAPAAPAVDAEAEAKKLLQFAENFLQANMKHKAIIKYEELVEKYPQTEAGKTAKAKLATLGG
jgi:hypothetical protein